MPHNPARGVKVVIGGRHKARVMMPSRAEMKKIFAALDKLATQSNKRSAKAWRRWRALIRTAVFTGMRASELRGLHWEDVDLAGNGIGVTRRADERNIIGPVKSASSRRVIPISHGLTALLREWKLECPPGDLVFPNWRGNIESVGNVHRRAWTPILQRIGKHYTFHSLRHFHASLLIASGATPREVMEEMGHSGIQITFDTYGHLFPDDEDARQERANRIADTFG